MKIEEKEPEGWDRIEKIVESMIAEVRGDSSMSVAYTRLDKAFHREILKAKIDVLKKCLHTEPVVVASNVLGELSKLENEEKK